ncbi:hypothetical protein [Sphingomonas sp. NFR04]|uniref:hypothetical protein n=1 Tax=Sphingomonas sp. NFR04 TaxID=1566283 RepID=UPI001587BBB8|nr:hypothetical protein [Sphingomonas sp. NFR04]
MGMFLLLFVVILHRLVDACTRTQAERSGDDKRLALLASPRRSGAFSLVSLACVHATGHAAARCYAGLAAGDIFL